MTGTYEAFGLLTGTDPGGPALANVPILSGTLSMDRTWAPAVAAELTFPWPVFDSASIQLVDPRTAQFVSVFIVDVTNGRQALWDMTIRARKIDAKAGTVTLRLNSFDRLVQDYGNTYNSINLSDVALYPDALAMVRSLVNTAVGTPAGSDQGWTAPNVGSIPANFEGRFVVPGGNIWEYVLDTVQTSPGGAVQHYGFGTDAGDSLGWLMSAPSYSRTPAQPFVLPEFPVLADDLDPGDVDPIEWTAEIDRDAEGWGNAMYAAFPRRVATGSTVLITAGTTFNYEYDERGRAGLTTALRRQVQMTRPTYPAATQAIRDARADLYLSRRAVLARAQTFTIPLDTRLLPYQVYADPQSANYMVLSVMHNIADGTSVVQVTATP